MSLQTYVVILCAFIIALLGLFYSKRDFGLWVMIGSIFIASLYFVVDPFVTKAWMQLSVLIAILALSIAFMSWKGSFKANLFFIVALALFNFLSYFFEAKSLIKSGSFLARGGIASLMILSMGVYSLIGWRRMVDRAELNDKRMQEIQENITSLERDQKSQKMWRDLVTRVHETTLNTIRSVLTMREVPLESMRESFEKLLSKDRALMTSAHERRSNSVIGAIRAGIDGASLSEKVKISSQGINLHLSADVAQVVEQVVRESIRNSIEHGQAKNIEVHWSTKSAPMSSVADGEIGTLLLRIADDGQISRSNESKGIGTSLVIAGSVRELEGSFSLETGDNGGSVVQLEIPTTGKSKQIDVEDFPSFNAFDLGRYMALLTLFGPAMTGLIFFPLLIIWWPGQFSAQVFGFLSMAFFLYFGFVRVKKMGWIESVLSASLLLATVYSLNLDPLSCVEAQPFQWVINSVVYGLFIVMLWGKWQVTAISYPAFLYLMKPFSALIPDDCNYIFIFPLLNTLFSFLFVWIVFYTVYKSFERVESFQASRRSHNKLLVDEIERSDAAFEKILELDTYAQSSLATLVDQTGPISSEAQLELHKIDAQLRAEIQIDPVSSSGLTLLAREFVNAVIANNHWLEVKSIHGDEDRREIPKVVKERFMAIASDIPSGSTIQLLISDERSELTLRCKGQVPVSVEKFISSVHSFTRLDQSLSGISVDYQRGADEFLLFFRREKLSQQM